MEEAEKKKREFEAARVNTKKELENVQAQIKNCDGDGGKVDQLQKKLKELEVKQTELESKAEEMRVQEKKTPWNVDTISKVQKKLIRSI